MKLGIPGTIVTERGVDETVDLVIRCEGTFGIEISDADAERIQTIGHLQDYIIRRLSDRASSDDVCQTARMFYRMRWALVRVTGVERKRVRLNARLEDLVPSWRSVCWHRLQWVSLVKWPPLVRPLWVVLASLGIVITAFVYACIEVPASWGIWAYCLIPAGLFMCWITLPLANRLPEPYTMADAVRIAISNMKESSMCLGGRLSESEIRDIVLDITADVTGFRRDQLAPEMKFVDDLGCG